MVPAEEVVYDVEFDVGRALQPLITIVSTLAIPLFVFNFLGINVEKMPVNFLQNTFSDRTHCIAQLRLGSSFLLSVLDRLGLEFSDREIESAFHRQRAKDIQREGRSFLKITPLCCVVYLYVGQYAMFVLTMGVLPFFFIDVPTWAWKAVGKYPGTVVQVVSWLYLFDADAPTFSLMSAAVILVMASYSFGRLCFVTWSGYALQVVAVFACQVDFCSRLAGQQGKSVGAVFVIVNTWLLMRQYIMLLDRRESFARLRQNVSLNRDISLHMGAIDVMTKGVAIFNDARETLHVNSTWSTITGYGKDAVVGRGQDPFRLLGGPSTDTLALAAIDQAIEKGEEHRGEIIAYKRDGTAFWNEFTIRPVVNQEGVIEQFIATFDDVTKKILQARTILQQKIIISNQAKTNADSADMSANSLREARRAIASQAAEHAELLATITLLRAQMIPHAHVGVPSGAMAAAAATAQDPETWRGHAQAGDE